MTWETQYLDILQELVEQGSTKENRTGTTTRYVFDRTIRIENISKNFPLITTKKVFYKGVVEELLFFLRGETNTKKLEAKGVNIWKGNTTPDFLKNHASPHVQQFPEGLMGPGYSWQFRRFGSPYEYEREQGNEGTREKCEYGYYDFDQKMYSEGFDQVAYVLEKLKINPTARDIVISLWNPPQHKDAVLPPCHVLYVFSYEPVTNKLNLSMTQRSCDFFLGVPFNIASCATLLTIMAKAGDMIPGDLAWHGVDVHLYEDHIAVAKEQLRRTPKAPPTLQFEKPIETIEDIEALQYEDFVVQNYKHHEPLKAPMAA